MGLDNICSDLRSSTSDQFEQYNKLRKYFVPHKISSVKTETFGRGRKNFSLLCGKSPILNVEGNYCVWVPVSNSYTLDRQAQLLVIHSPQFEQPWQELQKEHAEKA